MIRVSIINKYGVAQTMPKPDKPLKFDDVTKEEQEIIDFCLNCTKPKCNGNCKKLRDKIRELHTM